MLQFQNICAFIDSFRSKIPTETRLICEEEPNSYSSEQYKSLASKLLGERNQAPIKSAVVTSSQPGEGKTTTVCNLALVMVKTFKKKVLIVDGDLRKPSIHKVFDLDQSPGLTDLTTSESNSLESAIQQTRHGDLFVLPAGSESSDPAQLLNSKEMTSLASKITGKFDFIFYDTSPVLFTSDAQALGKHGDVVLFLVQADVTPREMIKEAVDRLKNTGSEPDACILTNTTRQKNLLSYIHGYKYSNYYNDQDKH